MMDLFTPDGHLTDQGLKALIDGTLDETERLEVGEHLSFCDKCIDRYTALLTGEVLMEPENDQVLPTMRRVQKRRVNDTLRRYAAAAAAVAIGSTLWYTGIFTSVATALAESPTQLLNAQLEIRQPDPASEHKQSLGDTIWNAVDSWSAQVRQKAAPAFTVHAPQQDDDLKNTFEAPADSQQSTKENHK